MSAGAQTPNRGEMPSGQLLQLDPDQALFTWNNVVVVAWRGECTAPGVTRFERAALSTLLRWPQGVVLLGVIEPGATPPSQEMRSVIAASNDRMASKGALAFAAVFSGAGFFGSAVRGVVTGLTLLARRTYPFRVFPGHQEAVQWFGTLLEPLGVGFSVDECSAAVGEFRHHYEQTWNREGSP